MHHYLKLALKFIFAALITGVLISKGKLDFTLAQKALDNPGLIFFCMLLVAAQASIATFRWKKLLQSASKKVLPMFKMLKLTWIGLFFSSVLPGAVTGDLIKLVYARDLDQDLSKTFLIMSVLFDRILGLMGLLFLMGIFSLISYSEIVQVSPMMAKLIKLNLLLFIGVILFLVWIFSPYRIQKFVLDLSLKIPIIGARIHKTFESIWKFSRSSIIWGLLLSMLSQALGILAFWLISRPFYTEPISFIHAFTFMPLGLIAVAVPIAPAGLGIGHAIFDSLFNFFHIAQGANLFNLHFLIYVTVNLLGVIPYLLSSRRPSEKAMQELT